MKNKKKGFTIVELVIVIAVIGILAAVLIPTFSGLINKAQVASDSAIVKNINTQLSVAEVEDGKNATMYDALQDAKEAGFLVSNINARSDNQLVWDETIDRFALIDKDGNVIAGEKKATKDENLWVISKNVDTKYSTYYTGAATAINTTKGFDAGDVEGITAVNYSNNGSAQNVVIRTNSSDTELVVNAPNDTVKHYDAVGQVHVIAVDPNNCYEENGKAAFTQIDSGKYKTSATADVELLFVSDPVAVNLQLADGTVDHAHAISEEAANTINATNPGVTFDYDGNGAQDALDVYHHVHNDDKIGLTTDYSANKEKEAVVQAVQAAKDDEKFETAIVATKGSSVIECSLAEFRDRVNGLNGFEPESFEGYTITLAANVDLKNEEWAPIGTKEHPFRGKFDGANYAIKNLNVNSTTGYAGLFGVVVGSYQNTPRLVSDVWDDDNRSMKTNAYSEDKFTAVVKNLTIDGFSLNSTSSNYHGTLAGYAVDAYFANITVKNGTVSTTGKAGGVIGSTTGSVVFDTLKTESSVFVNATGHTAGGIIAGLNRDYKQAGSDGVAYNASENNASHVAVIVNCENNATVTGVGYTGGIVGQAGNTRGLEVVIYNCVNNGSVSQSSSNTNPMGGIVAATHSTYSNAHAVISNCTNNGTLTHTTTSTASDIYLAGIDAYGTNTKIYNCVNTGSVTGYATKVAGIAAGLSSTYSEIDADSCSNTGTILNTNQNGQTYDVYGGDWSKMDFNASTSSASSVSDIQALLNSSNIARQYNFVGYGSIAGTLTIDKALSNIVINADSRICSSIVIEGNRNQTITLNIPNLECTLSGNMSNVCLIIQGENSSITVAEETSLKELRILNGTSFTNNGTVSKLQLTDIPTVTNNGTLGFVTITVSGENTITNFTNNNIITAQAPRNNVNLIECAGNGTVNLLNNGTINYDFEDAPSGATSYIFLCKYLNSVTLNVKCSATSVIDGYQDKDWFCMFTASSANNYTVKYLEGAQFTVNGSVPSTSNYNRLVGRYQQVDSLD